MKDIELPPLSKFDHPEPRTMQWSDLELYAIKSYARAAVEADMAQRVPDGKVLVDRGALNMVINALRRDAADGRAVRGEMADALLASTPAPAQQEPSPIKAEHKTVTPSGTVVTRLELTDKAKESLRANVTHIPGIAKHQEQPQQERKPMTDGEIEDLCGEANRGFCIELEDYKKAVQDTERHHGIRE